MIEDFKNNHIYQNNYQALSKRYPGLASFIDALDIDRYRLTSSISGQFFISVTRQDNTFINIHDVTDPTGSVHKLIPQVKRDNHLFVIMGMGLGYLFFETRKIYPKSHYLIIEHDPRLFKMALATHDFSKYLEDDHCEFFIGVKKEFLKNHFLEYFHRDNVALFIPNMMAVSDPEVVRFSTSYYQTIPEIMNRAVDMFWNVYVGNSCQDQLVGAQHVFQNLSKLTRMLALEPYQNYFKDKVGVLVSSGPSLNTKLEALKKLQEHAVIICADSALRILLENGIKPFAVTCIERDYENVMLFKGYDIPNDIILIAPLHVRPELISNYPGPICTLFRKAFPFEFLPPLLPLLNLGLSCSHISFLVLESLGCKEIALFGQDLAYDRRSGESHYDGAAAFTTDSVKVLTKIYKEDNQGGLIPTTYWWTIYWEFFEDIIKKSTTSVFNVIEKEKGMKIPSAECIDLASYLKHLESSDLAVLSQFDQNLGRNYLLQRIPQFYEEFDQKMIKALQDIKLLREKISIFLEVKTVEEYFQEKKKIWSTFDSSFKDFIETYCRPKIVRFDVAAFALWSDEDYCTHNGAYVSDMKSVLFDLENVVQDYLVARQI